MEIENKINQIFDDNKLLEKKEYSSAVEEAMELLDKGKVRSAAKSDNVWQAHLWVKKAILLYFRMQKIVAMDYGYTYYDKIKLKSLDGSVRVTPLGTAIRYGSFLEAGAVVMAPSYVNIGAYVGAGTMVDSHVLVGSCAQIGKNVHLSAGVVIGGVLEPPQATPVIVEDDCFIGGQTGLYEGVVIRKKAVLASGLIMNKSTPIFDATTGKKLFGEIPENAVVISGTLPKETKFGSVHLNAGIIIKYRDEKTSAAVALEEALR